MNKLSENEIESVKSIISEKFAQKPSAHDRFFGEEVESHLGEKYIDRNEFSRDRDRILYTNAFRRLQHKAQIYSNKKGDHYRTRLTHTLEVNQIAKSISKNLGLNIDLTEAIALGHDIGHTPFGHAGEEVLDNIMKGQDDLGGKLEYPIDYGGFKHNMNSIKILEIIEEKGGENGLNLTWQTLDGILKHTSIIKEKKDKKWDLRRFVEDYSNYDFIAGYDYYDESSEPKYKFPLTLEGQVVAIADEIAQRQHDINDSLRDKELDFINLFENIEEKIKFVLNDFNQTEDDYDLFIKFENEVSNLKSSDDKLIWNEFFSLLISYFIIDVTENTMINISQIVKNDTIDDVILISDYNKKYITEELVEFSKVGKRFNDLIEEFVEKKIINSFNVNRFDGKGKYILRQLFKAYYENPRQMPKNQLKILSTNLLNIVNDYPILNKKFSIITIDFKELFNIDQEGLYFDYRNIDSLLEILKFNSDYKISKEDYDDFSKSMNELVDFFNIDIQEKYDQNFDFNETLKFLFFYLFNYVNCYSFNEIKGFEMESLDFILFLKGWVELHYAYLSVICDYISQMTDDYALKEYEELYSI